MARAPARRVARDPVARVIAAASLIRFGSFAVRFETDDDRWAAMVPRRFRVSVEPLGDVHYDAVLRVDWHTADMRRPEAVATDTTRPIALAHDTLTIDRDAHGRVRAASDAVTLIVDTAHTPIQATLTFHPEPHRHPPIDVEHCFATFIHKFLQLCGVIRLHGAAVTIDERTSVFLGDKGAGKSTLSLALGRAGAEVLADDQLVIRRRPEGVYVSGCDGNIRLTARSEQHFFDEPLDVVAQDFAGVQKKELPLAGLTRSVPFQDRRPSHLYFPRVTSAFAVRPIARRTALLRVLNAAGPAHSFADAADRLNLVE